MPRMKILNNLEREAFEALPLFNAAERKQFFAMPRIFIEMMESLKTPTHQVCFIITVGYFKAERRFFGKKFRPADIEFVARQLGFDAKQVKPQAYDTRNYKRHQQMILSHFGVTAFDPASRTFIAKEIATMVRVQLRPKLVFMEAVQALRNKKIAIPTYFVLSKMIALAMTNYQRELVKIIDGHLTPSLRTKLDELLDKTSGIEDSTEESAEDSFRYPLTLLKKPSQSTQPGKIKVNLTDLKTLLALYLELKPVVAALALNTESIRYYAYVVIKSQIPQVSRRPNENRYLHLIAFIVYQTFRLHDTLIDTLLSAVQATVNAASKEHKESYYHEREGRKASLLKLADNLKSSITETLSTIKQIIADDHLTDHQKVMSIDAALNAPAEPRQTKVEQQMDQFKLSLTTIHQGRDYYALLEELSLKLQNRVSEIVRQVEFNPDCSSPTLWAAIKHYQRRSASLDKNAPLEFLSAEQRTAVIGSKGKLRVSLYKALLYIEVAGAIRSGALNLIHSEKYRSLDDYLIPKEDWVARRDEYLQRAQLTKFADCQTTLASADLALDLSYNEANRHLKSGENEFLKMHKNGTFHVRTPKLDEVESLSLGSYFPERKYIPLIEALATVASATDFLSEFEHWQVKSQRRKPAKQLFFAGIMGYGCDIGHRKLAQISKHISENELESTVNWYFSLANVQGANDRILQVLDRMALPNVYRQIPDLLHTSSDGQKFQVSVDSLNANYSFKYLGKDKGVSVVTFIDMRHMQWHSTVISSAEREAAFVIDGLMHNDVVKSDIHSTDTHGYSEVIFAATYLLGFSFAPRIKGLGKQQLYSFKNRKHYEQLGHIILPDRYINSTLITEQWDEILRFVATIRLKVTTASQLFKRLNSYSKQHPLYQALKEFGRIPKTIFILKYIDEPEFRQAIEKQLNKIESAQKFSKAVSFGHNNEFIQSEKEDQEIAEACRRLIKNAIICWNYLYLSRLYNAMPDDEKKAELLDALRNGSIATWRHFNLHGEFDFSDEKMLDSVGLAIPKNLVLVKARNWEGRN